MIRTCDKVTSRIEKPSTVDKVLNLLLSRVAPLVKNDRQYLKWKFRFSMGYPIDFDNPQTFYEKLQWLKLYNRKPEYSVLVDKYEVKKYVSNVIGDEYVIPTLGVWDKVEDIDWEKLPNQFVLKCTHDSGGIVICRDKSSFDKNKAIQRLSRSLKINYYWQNREWPYKNVQHRIIAEDLLDEGNGLSPKDYKVLTFNGKAKLIEVITGRFTDHLAQDIYDINWNKTNITQGSFGKVSDIVIERPQVFDEMIRLSEKLAKGIPHVRIDWYIVKGRLYFGEITFFDGSGFDPWDRYEDDLLMGSWITLPEIAKDPLAFRKGLGNEGIDMFYGRH